MSAVLTFKHALPRCKTAFAVSAAVLDDVPRPALPPPTASSSGGFESGLGKLPESDGIDREGEEGGAARSSDELEVIVGGRRHQAADVTTSPSPGLDSGAVCETARGDQHLHQRLADTRVQNGEMGV